MNRSVARAKAKALVAQMTVEEKASQLRFDAPAIPRLGVPAYNWWNEALHGVARAGVATSFPQAIGMAAMFDDALLQRLGDVAATEGRAKYNIQSAAGDRDIYKGLTFWSPNINLFRDPRWGRGHETYGEDPYLTGRLGKAYVRGLQGDGEYLKSAACAKHFAVHSGPEGLRHSFNAEATPKDMEETYLRAFRDCVVDAKVEAVMGAYNRTNGEPCCGSQALMVDILRGKWGFEGHYVSDCWAIKDFHDGHHVTKEAPESATLALKMGCDVNCGCVYQQLMIAYQRGMVTEEEISQAAERLFTTRYLLGIMGEGCEEFDNIPFTVVECPEHLALAQEAARKACVLLKNDGILPLNPETVGTIGVIGPNANNRTALIGNYYGTSSRYITPLEGIQDAMAGHGRVLYSEGCHLFRRHLADQGMEGNGLAEAMAVAKNSDLVVLVLGLDETLEGEEGSPSEYSNAGDKFDLLLPPSQRLLMNAVLELDKPMVVLLLSGSAIDLAQAQEKANAVMQCWYPGAGGGKAVAELLFGKASPSGKLPVTFYHNEALAQMPDFTDYSMENRTYRYYTGKPLYPFGYGLTYGDVAVTGVTANREQATVTLCNRGRDTEDVVQLYIKDNASPDAPTNPILCGFLRVSLAQGEEKTLQVPIDPDAFTVVNQEGQRIPGSGSWTLFAGTGQPDSRTAELTGKTCVTTEIRD